MRYSASEKYEIIRTVERSSLPVNKTLQRLDIRRSTFYAWLKCYEEGGVDALQDRKPVPRSVRNKLPQNEQIALIELALEKPDLSARDVKDTLDDALCFTGLDTVKVKHKPRLLSDNGPSYIVSDLAKYLAEQDMKHTRGRPYHPQTHGKIDRWNRSLKNQILLENYYLPAELGARIGRFVDYYNNERYHESLNNLTPADVYFGRGESILARRKQIELNTMAMRRKMHARNRVESLAPMS